MLIQFEGMKNIVLACGSYHMHLMTGNSQMNQAGIHYYGLAMSEVNRALNRIDWNRDDFNDALMMAIIMMYIHGVSALGFPFY